VEVHAGREIAGGNENRCPLRSGRRVGEHHQQPDHDLGGQAALQNLNDAVTDQDVADFFSVNRGQFNVAGGLAIVVALFPTTPDRANGVVTSTQTTIGVVHFTAATLLLLVLAYFCLGVFTRSKSSTTVGLVLTRSPGEAPRKSRRNKIYRVCGWLIVASIVAAGLIAVAVPRSFRESWNTLFWCETVAVVSFAMAWLTKGGAFGWCNDQPTVPTDPN
jgi:hypothetical protein